MNNYDTSTSFSSNEFFLGIVITVLALVIIAGLCVYCWAKKRKPLPSKAVPLASLLKGQANLPTYDEFMKLPKYEDDIIKHYTTCHGTRYNQTGFLNLIPENLPFDHNRVKLDSQIFNKLFDDDCDYINASWHSNSFHHEFSSPNYWKFASPNEEIIDTTYPPYQKIQFVIGQDPIPTTKLHHIRLIVEHQIDVVVSLSDKMVDRTIVDRTATLVDKDGTTTIFNRVYLDILNRREMKMICNESLLREEINAMATFPGGPRKLHNFVYFDVGCFSPDWMYPDFATTSDIEKMVQSICSVREELKHIKSFPNIFVHDSRGGVQGASLFVLLYKLMQQIDEGVTEGGQIKQGMENLDVASAVNWLRKDRKNAIEDFGTYHGLLRCLNYYGLNRNTILQNTPNKMIDRFRKDVDRKATGNPTINATTKEENGGIEYVSYNDTNE